MDKYPIFEKIKELAEFKRDSTFHSFEDGVKLQKELQHALANWRPSVDDFDRSVKKALKAAIDLPFPSLELVTSTELKANPDPGLEIPVVIPTPHDPETPEAAPEPRSQGIMPSVTFNKMAGVPTDLRSLVNACHQTAKLKGFWDESRNIGELLMLVVSELSEALEADRKGRFARNSMGPSLPIFDTEDERWVAHFEKEFKDTFEDEIADALIRIFDLCGGLGIPILHHITLKMKYNETRERLHGKKY